MHSLIQKHSRLSQLERSPFAQGRNGKSCVLQPRPTYLSITIKTPIHQAKTQSANPLKIPNPPTTSNKLIQDLFGSLILITFHPCFHIKLITMRPGKTTHIFQLQEHSVRFTGNFDTGNLRNVLQVAPFEFEIQPAIDSYQVSASSKAFFHFLVQGFPEGQTLKLVFRNLALLNCLREDGKRYRPLISQDGSNYKRLSLDQVQIYETYDGLVLRINVQIKNSKNYFAFAQPYSYERYLNLIRDLPESNQEMQISKEVLCYSNNLNLVYVITITSQSRFLDAEERVCENSNGIILPEKHLHPPRKYCDKPVILISSRVHPGESTSSWAVEGMINFLVSDSEDAKTLRKHFQIVIVPMLNPDGVEEGLYRLDTKGHNLNRYYLVSDNRQPSIYCMKHLIRHYQQTKRLLYYFDVHGHPSQKGAFLYGNAIDELPYQAETQLFGRLLTILCPTFQEKFCIFDREQMNSKDRYDLYTKQGCARVFTYRLSKIIHSYTIQLGFHGLSDTNSDLLYEPQHYFKEGHSILEAILISSGLKQHPQLTLPALRKTMAYEICNREERFRKQQRHLQQKKQNVNEILQSEYWKPIYEAFFPDVCKLRKTTYRPIKQKLKLQKKDSCGPQFHSFCSEQSISQKPLVLQPYYSYEQSEKYDQTSLADILDEPKRSKHESKHLTFKLHRNYNSSFKSTNVSTKSQCQDKLIPKQLVKLPLKSFQSFKGETSSIGAFKQKLKSLKKPIALRSIDQHLPRQQQHLFSDFNIREVKLSQFSGLTRPAAKSSIGRNKIHSLFIQTHY